MAPNQKKAALVALLFLFAFGLSTYFKKESRESTSSNHIENLRLALLIVVDQGSPEYFERYKELFTGGFKKLLDAGAFFPETYHEHAVPVTAPGHATIATGVHPSIHGVIDNYWYDRESSSGVTSVFDREFIYSPKNIRVSGIGDWIKKRNALSKVFGLSGKDRGAILLAGHAADGAYWFDKKSGKINSSHFYPKNSPNWMAALNSPPLSKKYIGTLWEAPKIDSSVFSKLGVTDLDQGVFPNTFPHALGGSSTAAGLDFLEDLADSPFIDQLTFEAAKGVILEEDLGADDNLDLLTISFSALDTVGHRYGAHSPEVLDTLLRLDQLLDDLFALIDGRNGLNSTLVVVSSDHGVEPFPEALNIGDAKGKRESARDRACIQATSAALSKQFGGADWFLHDGYLNYKVIEGLRLQRLSVQEAAAKHLTSCPSVEKVWILPLPASEGSNLAVFYRNAYDPVRSPDFLIQRKKFYLETPIKGTTHTAPYEYNFRVPLFFLAPGIPPGIRTERVSTTAIAPTVASILSLEPASNLSARAIVLKKDKP